MGREPSRSQFRTFTKILHRCFNDYGGWHAIITSPFFVFSFFASALSYKMWLNEKWPELVVQVIPNMLGFSLGTFAILFGLMSKPLKDALRNIKNKRGILYIDEINATFMHFILVQVISIVWAILWGQTALMDLHDYLMDTSVCKWNFLPYIKGSGAFLGVVFFYYSLALTVPASLVIFRIAKLREPD